MLTCENVCLDQRYQSRIERKMPYTTFNAAAVPTDEDWEARRAQITQLYQNDNETLQGLMMKVNTTEFKAT